MNVGALALDDLQTLHAGGVTLTLPMSAREAIRQSHAVVAAAAAVTRRSTASIPASANWPIQRIGAADLDTLQLNLIRSHSVGVGEPLAPAVVRLMLALKAASLARASLAFASGGRYAAGGLQRRADSVRAQSGLGRRVLAIWRRCRT